MENINFLFYESFWKSLEPLPDDLYVRVSKALIRKCLYGTEPDLSTLENALVNQMFVSVEAARSRYEKAKTDGAKGGRPSKQTFIPPEEWQAYLKDHTQDETAEHFGITTRTLRNWIKTEEEKTGKNLTVTDTDTVTVTATDTDTVTSICINKNNKGESDASALTGIVLPNIREGCRWVGEPYILASGRWACHYEDENGEERTMVL